MTTVDLVWFNAGGGHRAAAQALEQVMQLQGSPWRVRKINLTEVLDKDAVFKRLTGIEPEDLYNKRLASGFTLGLAQELKLLQGLIRLSHSALVQRLARHWQATQPDLVVSLVPNFNRCLHDSLALARPGVPFVTVLTDMADHPPHFCVHATLVRYMVVDAVVTGHVPQSGTMEKIYAATLVGVLVGGNPRPVSPAVPICFVTRDPMPQVPELGET